MSIIKTKETNYYELDWDVPYETIKKVYLAIKGNIEKGTTLPIMTESVGYDWQEETNSAIKLIPKNEFLEKAKNDNIVYFYKKENNYNELLDYPKELQKYMDTILFRNGFKPHGIIPLKIKLSILKENRKLEKEFKKLKDFER